MSNPLTAWLTEPRPGRGVSLAGDDGEWSSVPYADLAADARGAGAAMAAAGVRAGDIVAVLMPTGLPYLSVFFGAWAAGGAPCPIVPPSFQSKDEYVTHVAEVLRQAEPALVATCEEYRALIGLAMQKAGRRDEPWIAGSDPAGAGAGFEPRGRDLGLLQFTSGSSGHPRGARASWRNLSADIAMICEMIGWREGDGLASWLPLHHDMGLIGSLLTTVSMQGDLWLMQPEQFMRRPMQWLSCFEPGKGCHAASPSFAFAYIARRVSPEQIARLDLSHWRTALIGAEAINPAALDAFARLAAPAGFSIGTFRPAYGLAEATLAVSVGTRSDGATAVRVDPGSLRFGGEVALTATARLGGQSFSAGDGWLLGHGSPPAGHGVGVAVVDEEGLPLPERRLGEISVEGPIVTDGYHGGRTSESTRFVDGVLRTGDAGFMHDGELYILGRMGDSLKVSGRSVYVEDLDGEVADATGLDRARLAVVSTYEAGTMGVTVFAETRSSADWAQRARGALASRLGPDFPVTVVFGRRGLIKRTSSGKPRRRHMWNLIREGRLENVTVVPSPGPAAQARS
ncbi:MAG TPA: AMP-binding protein [Actinocrinis sp.]|jgi:acyl-CoA synthetase (AMP-forming)/AMP-acid ligase II